jgi:acetyl esterase/lipase
MNIPLQPGWRERFVAAFMRWLLYLLVRPVFGPPWPVRWQRAWLWLMAWTTPGVRGVRISASELGGRAAERIERATGTPRGVLLYLHGGGFIVGSPWTHRALTTRLALATGATVWVPEYRLAPEYPYPAAVDDCLACYRALLAAGHAPGSIVVGGDSAGGGLTLALALRLKAEDLPQPAGLLVISPVTDTDIETASHRRYRHSDPMLRPGLMHQVLRDYQLPLTGSWHHVLQHDLSGLPPLTIHVGSIEMLLDDSVRLADHARACGVQVDLCIFDQLYHVFHLLAVHLASARAAIDRLAQRFAELTATSNDTAKRN